MKCVEKNLGVSTADGEDVHLQYDGDDVILAFTDWNERSCELVFRDVLAFRWQECDEEGIRDDTTYEVTESSWLARQAQLQGVNASDYAHYKLCFNACGSLDVLARRMKE
jgi:hypothetical protein